MESVWLQSCKPRKGEREAGRRGGRAERRKRKRAILEDEGDEYWDIYWMERTKLNPVPFNLRSRQPSCKRRYACTCTSPANYYGKTGTKAPLPPSRYPSPCSNVCTVARCVTPGQYVHKHTYVHMWVSGWVRACVRERVFSRRVYILGYE